jgi:hypothetical protein
VLALARSDDASPNIVRRLTVRLDRELSRRGESPISGKLSTKTPEYVL